MQPNDHGEIISAELVWDGRAQPYQLKLDFGPTMNEAIVGGILKELHEDGLRDWLILHRLCAEQGRTERLMWTWGWHRERSAYDRRIRSGGSAGLTESEAALAVTRRLWRMKRAELRVLARLPQGATKWERIGPFGLIDIPAGISEKDGSLERAVLTINPKLYEGARKGDRGFVLVPDGALSLDGKLLRLATLLVLGMRCSMEDQCTIVRKAGTLWADLNVERGQPHRRHWPRAMEATARALEQLAAAEVIGGWRVESGAASPELRFTVQPTQAMRDQLIYGVPPKFPAGRAGLPLTGGDLREWREARGLLQDAAALALGVGERTLKRAEKEPGKPLGGVLREALDRAGSGLALPPKRDG